jgi:hypothetical protein
MKKISSLFTPLILVLLIAAGCGGKKEGVSNEEMIAGDDQKTWSATKETDSEGDKDKLTRAEKKQTITFWRNGNVKMGDGQQTQTGQWSYTGTTLSMQFTGSNVSENFTVVELGDDKMKLQAPDGSELTMKPD